MATKFNTKELVPIADWILNIILVVLIVLIVIVLSLLCITYVGEHYIVVTTINNTFKNIP
jgi:hypothetical protein